MPYYGYARQDRKTGIRTPISAKLVANLITSAGANKVLTLDLHAGQVEGFFDIPVDNLSPASVFAVDIKEKYASKNIMIISPDIGGVVRARNLAAKINADLAIVDKTREEPGISRIMNIIGEVKGRDCLLIDDIVDSAGTICNAAESLIKNGANSVSAYVTHGVLSGASIEAVNNSYLKELVITDSIKVTENVQNCKKIRVVSVALLIAEAIRKISKEATVVNLLG
jgi:ribose-phosphate pyrophosphokinase